MQRYLIHVNNRPQVSVTQGYTRKEVIDIFKEHTNKVLEQIKPHLEGMHTIGDVANALGFIIVSGTKEQYEKVKDYLNTSGLGTIIEDQPIHTLDKLTD